MKQRNGLLIVAFVVGVLALSYPAIALFSDPLHLLFYLGGVWLALPAFLVWWRRNNETRKP